MSPIEHRLSGHNATLAGLTRLIDRQLDKGALERIELRYSSQSPHRLSPQSVRDVIDRLVKEHGSPNRIEVSVRAYATAFDDALGEHLLRLFPQEARSASPARQVSLLYRLLARLLPQRLAHHIDSRVAQSLLVFTALSTTLGTPWRASSSAVTMPAGPEPTTTTFLRSCFGCAEASQGLKTWYR